MSLVSTFDLVIGKSGASYRVRVLSEALGWPEAKVSASKVHKALQERFADLLSRVTAGARHLGFPSQADVAALGEWLFATFFSGEVGAAWREFSSPQGRVRLRLILDEAPELSQLPWEALCSAQGFLALYDEMAVIRSLKGVRQDRRLALRSPVKLLFLEGPGNEESPLTVDTEFELLEKGVSAKCRKLEIRARRSKLSPSEVAADPHLGPFQILHFAGHGVSSRGDLGYSVVAGPDGTFSAQLSQDWATDLTRQKKLQLVVLNSCEGARHSPHSVATSLAHAIFRAGVPAVVAMQFPISNVAAVAFTRAFYCALARDCDLGMAMTRARQEIRKASPEEWLSPVLFLGGDESGCRENLWEWLKRKMKMHPWKSLLSLLTVFGLASVGFFHEVVAERYWRAVREARVSPKEWLVPGPPDVPGWKCPKLGNTGIELALIPSGEFLMGSNSGSPEEKPAHAVRLTRPYCIGKTEVTQAEWSRVKGDNPSEEKGPDLPVTSVAWERTQEFFAKLRLLAPGGSCSLPSEAQYEYSAGAGAGYAYGVPRASDLFDRGNFLGPRDGYLDLAPVKKFPPNLWGLFGMHGNAGEWVIDRPGPYPSTLAIDPTGPSESVAGEEDHRLRRGGSFENRPENATSTSRAVGPDRKMNQVGFRVVCAPVPQ